MDKTIKDIIVYTDPTSPAAEAIRCLRTNILFLNPGTEIKVVGLTSSLPGEGKSFISANLAVATAQSNKKTLLIDCDIRRGGMTRLLGLKEKEGLSNYLAKKDIDFDNLPTCNIGIDNLDIMPSGPVPPNPAELLGLNSLAAILSAARKKFDIIYLDMPPVLSVTDPMIVSKQADGAVFIVMAEKTHEKAVSRAYNLLKDAGVNILGAVLNKVPRGIGRHYGRYGRYGKYQYGDYYGKK
ncbi:MAG: CpsD/CapB family tyrosine-protein kinase [Candidatus Omnitrophica bacterium]|nr:CpsD/CapB family tyrosine-protein kinase [Candidatus Omnitrophota bacterium]